MTTTIFATSDTIAPADLANIIEATNHTLAKWAPKWGITAIVTADTKARADMVANVTAKNRKPGAGGFHNVVKGVPTAWICPAAVGNSIYGHYGAAVYSKAITVLGKVIKAPVLKYPARYLEGVVSVFVHEILEMLADANIDTVSLPDGTKAQWLVEVCDHVDGSYGIEVVNGHNCVIPGAAFPSYYDLKGTAPFDLYGFSKTPFDTNSPRFYGYSKDAKTGALTAIVKGSIHH